MQSRCTAFSPRQPGRRSSSGISSSVRAMSKPQGWLDIFEAYGADLAMVLCDDDIGPKRFELLRIDAIDGKPFLQDGLDAGIDVVARAAHREFRLRQGRQARYVGREVAFMGTADKEVASAERTDHLRRARNQRNHAFGLSIGHLAQSGPVVGPGLVANT